MAGNEARRGIAVAVLAPPFRQHKFFPRLEHRQALDFCDKSSKARLQDWYQ